MRLREKLRLPTQKRPFFLFNIAAVAVFSIALFSMAWMVEVASSWSHAYAFPQQHLSTVLVWNSAILLERYREAYGGYPAVDSWCLAHQEALREAYPAVASTEDAWGGTLQYEPLDLVPGLPLARSYRLRSCGADAFCEPRLPEGLTFLPARQDEDIVIVGGSWRRRPDFPGPIWLQRSPRTDSGIEKMRYESGTRVFQDP